MLTADDEEYLTALYQALDQREIRPSDDRYVDLYGEHPTAVGPDVVENLRRQLVRAGEGRVSFLSGLRGSGKSTQLLRLRERLEAEGFAVVWLNAERYLNVRRPVSVSQLLFTLAGGIAEVVAEDFPTRGDTEPARERLVGWFGDLRERLTLSTPDTLNALMGQLKLPLRFEDLLKEDGFVDQLDAFFADRVALLSEFAEEQVDAAITRIRAEWTGDWKGLVVVVDSLDHAKGREGDEADFRAIRDALESVFTTHRDFTALQNCRIVYCLPPYVRADGLLRHVATIKVRERDGSTHAEGMDAARQVLGRRMPGAGISGLLGEGGACDRVIAASGGNLRELFRLVQEVSIQADDLPADDAVVDSAIDTVKAALTKYLTEEERRLLRRVAESKDVAMQTQADWTDFSPLFDRFLVMAYPNGEGWYDVHPLVRPVIETG